MKILNNIRNYIGEDDFRMVIYSDKLNVINYDKLDEINTNKIIVEKGSKISIEGKNLEVVKLLKNEVLIKGKIINISIND